MIINKNIALVEYSDYHSECMHIQAKALNDKGYNVFLIISTPLEKEFINFNLYSDVLLVGGNNHDRNSFKNRMQDIRKIRKFTRENNINSIMLNTIEKVRDLLLFPLPKVKNYIGTAHTSKYITKSGTFKWACRPIKKVFLLSDNILNNITQTSRPLELSSFYPIYFQEYPIIDIKKADNEFWYCVPGATGERRDIPLLMKQIKEQGLPSNIKIVILGKSQPDLIDSIKQSGINNFIYFSERVPANLFASYMKLADMVLPLIHPENVDTYYGTDRISGTYNLAYGYKKPMLVETNLKKMNSDFKDISLSYTTDKMLDKIKDISKKPEEYTTVLRNIENHPYLNVRTQSERFIELIERNCTIVE